MRNYLSQAFREEDKQEAQKETNQAILEIQNNIDNLLNNIFKND